jgi:hypothetical protein
MDVLWTRWPNKPALARLGQGGIEVVKETATESEVVVAVLSGIRTTGMLLCARPPRWTIQLSDRIHVEAFGNCDLVQALRELVAEGRYRVPGGFVWTPKLHALHVAMNTPKPWSLEFTQPDGCDGCDADDMVEPRDREKGGHDEPE